MKRLPPTLLALSLATCCPASAVAGDSCFVQELNSLACFNFRFVS